MPATLMIHAILTDPEWKKLEKEAGISDTGVGSKLRALESSIHAVNAELHGKQNLDKLTDLFKTVANNAKAAMDTCRAAVAKLSDDKRKEVVDDLRPFDRKIYAYWLLLRDVDLKEKLMLGGPKDATNIDRVVYKLIRKMK